MKQEALTKNDLLETLEVFSNKIEKRIEKSIQESELRTQETIHALASHMDERFATQKDLHREVGRLEQSIIRVDQKVDAFKNEIVTHIDRFVVLHQTMDIELVSLRSRCDRIETTLTKNGMPLVS